MRRFLGPLELWFSGRTLRERRMLLVMSVLLAAVVAWLGVVGPVLAWRDEAGERAEAAAALLAEVQASVASLDADRPVAPSPAEGLEPLVRRTAQAAGLEITTAMSPSGHLGFQLARGSSGPLFKWLAALEADHRLSVCSLGVTENADATLNVEGALASGACG